MRTFPRPSELYKAAESRVDGSEVLSGYRDILLGDWPEGESHYRWVANAEESELLSWSRCVDREFQEGV